MIAAYFPDGSTEPGHKFIAQWCDEHPYTPEARREAILAYGAALGLADKAESLVNGTYWPVKRACAQLDALSAAAGPRPVRAAASPRYDSDGVDLVLARFRQREGRSDAEPVPVEPPRATAPVTAADDVDALLLRFRAREGRIDAKAPAADDVEALCRRFRQREGR